MIKKCRLFIDLLKKMLNSDVNNKINMLMLICPKINHNNKINYLLENKRNTTRIEKKNKFTPLQGKVGRNLVGIHDSQRCRQFEKF